jgi:4,5-dihydroxyphthalate decarboxylase
LARRSKLVPITIACAEYDRTRPINDGRVRVDGCEVIYLALDPEELFFPRSAARISM